MQLILGSFLDSIQLLVLLKFIQSFPLLFYHVPVGEWEVVDSLDCLHPLLIVLALLLLVLEDLVGLDEGIGLVDLVFLLKVVLLLHLIPLVLKQALLIFSFSDLVEQFSISLLVDLINDFA